MLDYHKVFKGEVKISDVQMAFDEIIARINNMIDAYNSSSYIADIDYSIGSKTLAPSGYTLSIGGLKSILNTYNNCVIGAKPFRVSSNKIVLTDGVLITSTGSYRLPTKEIDVSSSTKTIYYDTNSKNYVTSSGAKRYKVCDINMKSESDYVKILDGVLNQDFEGEYSITTESKQFGNVAEGSPIYPDTSKEPKFVSGMDSVRYQNDGTAVVRLFGTEVSYNWQQRADGRRDRCLDYWIPVNFLFLPRGISNPYSVQNGDSTKTFNAIVKKRLD